MKKLKDFNYFDQFLSIASDIEESAEKLKDTLLNYDYKIIEEKITEVHKLENASDLKLHTLEKQLIMDFLPPIDREDISLIGHRLDDIAEHPVQNELNELKSYFESSDKVQGVSIDIKGKIIYINLTVKEVESVPLIAIFLFGFKFKVPSPDIVKLAPDLKYITPSFSFEDESCKVDEPDKVIITELLESIIKGVNEPDEVNDNEDKINVAEVETNIRLFVFVPFKV